MAACGSSSNNPPSTNLTALTGTYVFQEQVYTYYSGEEGVHAPAAMTAKKLHPVNVFAERAKALGVMHRGAQKAHGVPAQGNVNSSVAWGGVVGAIQFDGQGNVIGGEIDYNEPTSGGWFSDSISPGSLNFYTVNSDNTGTLSIITNNIGAQFYFEFGLQGSTNGSPATGVQFAEGQEDDLGDIEIGTGTMLPQSGSLSQGSINGNYVFGLQGQTCYGSPCNQANQGDLYAAGLFATNGSGSIGSGSQADVSAGFGSGNLGVTGTYIAPDVNGRATASLTTTPNTGDPGALPGGYVFYIANSTTFFILSTDNNNTSNGLSPYLFGQAGLQTGSFSSASLSGNYVLAESTEDLLNENVSTADTYSDTYLALLSPAGGTLTGTGDSNKAGTVTTSVPYNYGAYTVASNGRVTLTGSTPSGAPPPVFWLQSSSFGYGVDQLEDFSNLQEPGLLSLYQQSGSSFSAGSFSGNYALGTLPASTSLANLATGVVASDGSSNISGDIGVSSLLSSPINSATATYTISSSGRGTTTGSGSSLFGDGVLYVVSPGQTLFMDLSNDDTAPSIQNIQQ
jgi:hypothetical protein